MNLECPRAKQGLCHTKHGGAGGIKILSCNPTMYHDVCTLLYSINETWYICQQWNSEYCWDAQKNSYFTSDKHYLWNSTDFESVISLKFIHFYKKIVA